MKRIFVILTLLSCTVFLTQCGDSDESATGRLVVQLVDAPFPTDRVAEANVTITKIEARQKSDTSESSFITLTEDGGTFNLLELTNGVTATLADIVVPVGSYDLVRIFVADAEVILTDGGTFDLKIPSGSQSGIKVFIDPAIEVAGNLSADLILDFDVSKSFVAKGPPNNPNGFNFKPVIKATNNSIAGSLIGTVTDSLSAAADGAQITVLAADTAHTSTFADGSGNYAILGLEAGLYDVVAEYQTYEADTARDVQIIVANSTRQDFQLDK